MPSLGKLFRWGTLPVVLTSLLFAQSHFRLEGFQYRVEYLLFLVAGTMAVKLLAVLAGLVIAFLLRGATLADLGFVPNKIPADVGLGLIGFFAVAVPIRDYAGSVIGTVGITVLTLNYTQKQLVDELMPRVRQAGEEISRAMGYTGD